MDPNSGRLYASAEAALAAGVPNPVELIGALADIERISRAVKVDAKKRRKQQKASRKANR